MRGKFWSILDEGSITKEKLGNWIGVTMKYNRKAMLIINVYRLPNSSQQGPKRCLTQYNILEGNTKTASDIRKETLT